MIEVKLIFGPYGDMGLAKAIYDLKCEYGINAEIEFDILYDSSYPLLQIGDKLVKLVEYSENEIRNIIENILNNGKVNYVEKNENDLLQNYHKDLPPDSNFSEVLI